MSVNVGADRVLQDQHAGELLPHRHPAARLLRRRRRACRSPPTSSRPRRCRRPSRLPDELVDRADRLRQLGRVGIVDGAEQRRLRASTSPTGDARHGHRRQEPDPLRRAQRRQPLRHPATDLRRDAGRPTTTTAATASTRAPSPARPATRWPTRPPTPSPTTARSTARFATDRGASYLYYAEYQMIRWLEENGYDVSYTSESDVDSNGALLMNHKVFMSSGHDEYWSAGQRSQRRTRCARSGRQPRVLQRQRDLLEDALGTEQRRLQHALSDARQLQGDPFQRARRPRGPADLDRGVARSALQPAGRRRPARKRADRPAVRGQLGNRRHHGALPVQQAAAVAQHGRRQP